MDATAPRPDRAADGRSDAVKCDFCRRYASGSRKLAPVPGRPNAYLITHYPQPSEAWYKKGTYSCFCGFERWRATGGNFKRGSARPSLLFFTEQRISAERR